MPGAVPQASGVPAQMVIRCFHTVISVGRVAKGDATAREVRRIISEEMKWLCVDVLESRCDRVRMTSGAHLVARLHVDLRRQASAVCTASR